MRRPLLLFVAGALAVAVVAACQGAAPSPSGSTTPTSSAVASAAGSAQLYAEAEQIYRAMRVEMEKLERAGGADELPPELSQYVTGYLEETLTGMYRYWKEEGLVLSGQSESIEWIRPYDRRRDGSLVALAVCSDGTKAELSQGGTPSERGDVAINYYFFKHFDGVLKGFDVEYKRVESCSAV